jgi:glycerol-3-phosphate dehydrogenase
MEPNVSKEAILALFAPSAGIIAPWELVIAQAECAVQGGAKIQFDTKVTGIKKTGDHFTVATSKGDIEARYVVNAAGVNSDIVSQFIEPKHFEISPKRGEYYLLDTTEGSLVNYALFPCPSKLGKGVMVAPTVHGNIIIGPDSTDCARDATESTAAGLEYVQKNAVRVVPGINFRASIRNFSGVRADASRNDFIVGESETVPGFFNMAGIKSPGLTSAPSIAKDVVKLLGAKLDFKPNPNFVATRKVTRFKHLNAAERAEAIKKNPLYGTIVCRCMTVTEGEIVDALNRPIPPRSLDALKRRTSAGMGRCQRGFCGPRAQAILAKYFKIDQTAVPQDSAGTWIINGRTKGERT